MNILGIETSCDETAAAVVQDGTKLLSNVIVSQIDIHREFGGVVPEVAARSHIEVILPVVEKALHDAFGGAEDRSRKLEIENDKKVDTNSPSPSPDPWDQIDGIAVTYGPGLLGSLLIGTLTARTLTLLKNKPLYGIHHVEAHTYANLITEDQRGVSDLGKWTMPSTPSFPLLSLTVSGGHSQLVLFQSHEGYHLLGQTQDDAVGEAFDKVAKMLGLGYPGGPAIATAAQGGDPYEYRFPKSKLASPYDFSFSGLKTAVLRHLQQLIGEDYSFPSFEIAARLTKQQVADTAASFQHVAIETLVEKTVAATHEFQPAAVVIAGGVAANQELRRQLKDALPLEISYAPPILCTDNAAMIASRGYFTALASQSVDPLLLETLPSLPM